MAERRMFAKTIIDSDAFLDMPPTSQLLYFHLSMRADDDGFINNPKAIMRNARCNDDDMKLLITKKFIIPFESGIVVIKHWKIHNYIAKDRYKETKYKDEKALLSLDENNSYTQNANTPYTTCIQPVDNSYTQVREGKDRKGKDSIGECREEAATNAASPTPTQLHGTYNNVILSEKELKDLATEFPAKYEEYIDRLSTYMAKHGKTYKNHFVTIKSWLIEDKAKDPASFDADVFFAAAVNKTKAKKKEPTPEEREALRQRVEALKQQIG